MKIDVETVEAHDRALSDIGVDMDFDLTPEMHPWLMESLLVRLLNRHGAANPAAFMTALTERVLKRHAAGENGYLRDVLTKPVFARHDG